MKHVSIYLTGSLILVALIVGIAAGYYITPEYKNEMDRETSLMDLGEADKFVDLRYINKMIAHHTSAILLAEQAQKNTTRAEIHSLASEIQVNEPKLIEELYTFKKNLFGDTRVVAEPKVLNLGERNKNADLRFLNALIAHHEAGIKMTQEIKNKSSRNEILDNADSVENFLTTTLPTLQNWRRDWYFVK